MNRYAGTDVSDSRISSKILSEKLICHHFRLPKGTSVRKIILEGKGEEKKQTFRVYLPEKTHHCFGNKQNKRTKARFWI